MFTHSPQTLDNKKKKQYKSHQKEHKTIKRQHSKNTGSHQEHILKSSHQSLACEWHQISFISRFRTHFCSDTSVSSFDSILSQVLWLRYFISFVFIMSFFILPRIGFSRFWFDSMYCEASQKVFREERENECNE